MPSTIRRFLVVVCGPTGIGKTRVSIDLARHFGCEIISADSRQFFREMLIGTAVPDVHQLKEVPHHFIHSHSIHHDYNASMFENEVMTFLSGYFKDHKMVFMTGGSGLYIDAVLNGIDDLPSIDKNLRKKWQKIFEAEGIEYLRNQVKHIDPEYFNEADTNNSKRLLKAIEVFETTGRPYSSFLKKTPRERDFTPIMIGLNTGREKLYEKINERVDDMIEKGLTEEARKLYDYRHLTPLNTVGYKELFEHFEGKSSLEKAVEKIKNHSRAYARKQLTWFRKYKDLRWFEPENTQDIITYIESIVNI